MLKFLTWFKPRVEITVGGKRWIGTGHVVFASKAKLACNIISRPDTTLIAGDIAKSTIAATETERCNGHVVLNGTNVYAAHLLDVITFAHPGATWKIGADKLDPACAFVGAECVGLAAALRADDSPLDKQASAAPDCPTCEGRKGPDCTSCDGEGDVECGACGHDSECDDCDGTGVDGTCADCNGSGKWSAPK